MTCPTCGREMKHVDESVTLHRHCRGCGTLTQEAEPYPLTVYVPELVRLLIDDPTMSGLFALYLIGHKSKPDAQET